MYVVAGESPVKVADWLERPLSFGVKGTPLSKYVYDVAFDVPVHETVNDVDVTVEERPMGFVGSASPIPLRLATA